MKVYYRTQRGSLVESLKTEKVFNSFGDLKFYLSEFYNSSVSIEYYAFDMRSNIGTTFIVCIYNSSLNYYIAVGFAYLKDKEVL